MKSRGRTNEIDLHGMRTQEALGYAVSVLNANLGSCVRVVHGYGSGGAGGDTKQALRSLLRRHPHCAKWVPGEEAEGNPGSTLVYPQRPIPSSGTNLWESILGFCAVPRTEAEIIKHFGEPSRGDVLEALRRLDETGRLVVTAKNGRKYYQA
ncbi:MAG: Smr/MutS family protein [Bacillota bacterium]|nr:Smr/MutS family protein [Bacillota bacterium]